MPRLSRRVIRTLQIAIAVGLMLWLWQAADGLGAARLLAGAEPGWLLAALAALTAQIVVSALRWRLTAGRLGIEIAADRAVAEYYLSQIVNQALPGGMLGDAGRAIRARAQAGLVASGQAVIYERLAGQIGLFAILVPALALSLVLPGGPDWPEWLVGPVIGVVGAVLALPILLGLVARRMEGRVGRALARFGRGLWHSLLAPEVRQRQILLSLGTALANVAGFAFCAAAVGAPLPVGAALTLIPLILLSMLIPLTIGGWGLREGAAAIFLPLAGLTASEALAASVAFGLVFLAASLPGVGVVLLGAGKARAAR
jgi:glycosyltransferase 2 family protein